MLPVRVACDSIVLRPFAAADAARVALLCGSPEVARMTSLVPYPYTLPMAEAWIAGLAGPGQETLEHTYAILRRDDETLVGAIALRADPGATDNIGYWIGQPYWGRGYATAAVEAVIALGFTQLDFDEIRAMHLARNPASGRVMAKCGMREVRREMRPHRDGPEELFCVWSIDRAAWDAWMDR